MSNVTIKLQAPIPGHGKMITEVVLREPTLDDFLELGEIHSFARTPEGAVLTIEDKAVTRNYIDRLIVEPADTLLLSTATLTDARAIKGAVFSFFLPANTAAEPSETSVES